MTYNRALPTAKNGLARTVATTNVLKTDPGTIFDDIGATNADIPSLASAASYTQLSWDN